MDNSTKSIKAILEYLEKVGPTERKTLRNQFKGVKELDMLEEVGIIKRRVELPRIKEEVSEVGASALKLLQNGFTMEQILKKGISILISKGASSDEKKLVPKH